MPAFKPPSTGVFALAADPGHGTKPMFSATSRGGHGGTGLRGVPLPQGPCGAGFSLWRCWTCSSPRGGGGSRRGVAGCTAICVMLT